MSIFVVGDENTVIGFSLVGIEGEAVTGEDAARAALGEAVDREGVEIVLVTEQWAGRMRETVDQLKMNRSRPLVLEIPGDGTEAEGTSLRDLVQRAAGIRLGR